MRREVRGEGRGERGKYPGEIKAIETISTRAIDIERGAATSSRGDDASTGVVHFPVIINKAEVER